MRLPIILTIAVLVASAVHAQGGPVAPAKTPAATAPAAPTKMIYDFQMSPIKQKDLNFSLFRNRWGFFFYFSPTCGHCQHTYPVIQQFRAAYEKKGLAFAAIASGSSSMDDIRMFDADYKLDMPAFIDGTRQFGQTFGTGSVPVLFLVKPDGTFQSWVGFNDSTKKVIEQAIKTGLHIK